MNLITQTRRSKLMLRSIFKKAQMVKKGFFNRQMFWGKIASLICIALTALIISGAPAWAFDSSLPDNTVYVVYEFESGFHGGSPGAWGANDQLFIVKAVQVSIDQYRAAHLAPHIFVFPDKRRLRAGNVNQRAAVVVTGGDKDLLVGNNRVGGVDVIFCSPEI